MKIKIAILSSLVLLSGCALLEGGDMASQPTTTAKLKACSIEEAGKMVQSGKAFTQGISASADEVSNICLKRLTMQSMGLDEQATNEATSALSSLMNLVK